MRWVRIPLFFLVAIATVESSTFPQSKRPVMGDTANSSARKLISAVDAEKKKGVVLSYTQPYRSDGKPVMYTGTLYLAITAFSLKQCDAKVNTIVVDRFSGRAGEKPVGDTSTSYEYSADVTLTPEIIRSSSVSEESPSQLDGRTHPTCADHGPCTVHWLELQGSRPVIRLTIMSNDAADSDELEKTFDGMVKRFWIPVSSRDAGEELVSALQNFAASCRQ